MKKMSMLRKGFLPLVAILLAALTFSACKKDNNNEQVPAAGLMSFNLVPDIAPIGVAVSGNIVTNIPLEFTNYSGGYQALFIGERVVESFDWASRQKLASSTQNFKDSSYYSVFVVGSKDHVSQVLTEDKFEDLTDKESAYVRFINAIPDSSQSMVTMTIGGTDVVNELSKFKSVSSFTKVSPGDVTVRVSNEGSIDKDRTITLDKGKVYTVLLTGMPGSEEQEVDIKFVPNGTL